MNPHRCLLSLLLLAGPALAQLPDGVVNTKDPSLQPPSPQESLGLLTVPEEFRVTLFAGEPQVAQPIAINYDDRGRLWVAESFSYIEWKKRGQDRILIFEDTDNDGRFDKRTVFWDRGNHLSGFQIGHGGVWVCDAPNLLFIPDANRDDVPDGPPRVMLDGWTLNAEHNFFNGLTWGPDGWLYGRHGIKQPSRVGKPGTPDADRIELSCSIWRFHPERHEFDVYADGTVNPWGLDWNAEGQGFITTSVIDHLWHLVPGARYARRDGPGVTHPNPYTYEWMRPANDHRHWVGGEKERQTHDSPSNDQAGGGHSHCGLMIYQADAWPAAYRNQAFFSNVLGQRINMDHLERSHSGYVATHGADFLRSSSPWFRAVDLKQGPYGEVMVAEWTDMGECHDRDGVHRTSGRLYRVSYGESPPARAFDVGAMTTAELLALLAHENVWWRRHVLRNLHERAARGERLTDAQLARLRETAVQAPVRDAISAVQALHAMDPQGAWPESVYARSAGPERAPVRAQILTLEFTERTPDAKRIAWLEAQIPEETSPMVHLAVAGVLQRIPVGQRWQAASLLAGREIAKADRNLALMLWYGLEPTVPDDPRRAAELALSGIDPFVAQAIARRAIAAGAADALFAALQAHADAPGVEPVLEGVLLALPGRAGTPRAWPELYPALQAHAAPAVQAAAFRLALRFGDAQVEQQMVERIANPASPRKERVELLGLLASSKSALLGERIWDLIPDPAVGLEAIRAVPFYPRKESAQRLVELLEKTSDRERQTAILQTLASRADFVDALIAALESGKIDRHLVPTYLARQLVTVSRKKGPSFAEFWGFTSQNQEEKSKLLQLWKDRLPESYVARADAAKGRQVFLRACAACHRLYDEGGQIGPDLTGSNRANLDYFLLNTLFPSEDIREDYKLVTLTLNDGRTLVGNIASEEGSALNFREVNQTTRIEKADIRSRQTADISLMPQGLLDTLSRDEVRDLVGYLRTTAPLKDAQ